jgi:hypothetical protein
MCHQRTPAIVRQGSRGSLPRLHLYPVHHDAVSVAPAAWRCSRRCGELHRGSAEADWGLYHHQSLPFICAFYMFSSDPQQGFSGVGIASRLCKLHESGRLAAMILRTDRHDVSADWGPSTYGRPTSYEFLLSQHGHETARRKSNRRRDQEMPFGPRSYRFRLPTWCTRVQIGDIRGMWSWRSLQPRRPITPRRA